MKAYVFPGQGAQFSGMGELLYSTCGRAKDLFEKANEILGYRISDIMFKGDADQLKQTKVTQPAIFLHSVILAMCLKEYTSNAVKMQSDSEYERLPEEVLDFEPDMVAGHSLGEFSALVAAGAISFEDGLKLVYARAMAMQKACEATPSTMAAVLGLDDEKVEEVCAAVSERVKGCAGRVVVPANYNSPGQLVISGDVESINEACDAMKEAGAKRALPLTVGGAFHSPLMESARVELAKAIAATEFKQPLCPVYQNVDGKPHTNPDEIKENLLKQLTSPVRWTQDVKSMIADGAETFIELGPGEVLQGLVRRINKGSGKDLQVKGVQ